MKRKFLILTLCFTIIFSSINFKRSHADGGVISIPILATVAALAVGSNIVISSNDDLYDIGRMFYDYIDRHNDLTWSSVQSVFASSVALQSNKLVSVDSAFLDIVKGFFDDSVHSEFGFIGDIPIIETTLNNLYSVPLSDKNYFNPMPYAKEKQSFSIGEYVFTPSSDFGSYYYYQVKGGNIDQLLSLLARYFYDCRFLFADFGDGNVSLVRLMSSTQGGLPGGGAAVSIVDKIPHSSFINVSIPYNGGYTWDNIESKKENESVSLPIPGNLGQLVGQGSTDFWGNSDNLVVQGGLTIPEVDYPSIDVDTSINTFPSVDTDVPDVDVPDVDNPSIDKPNNGLEIFPPWGGGIDFTPVTQSSFIDKFPFSLGNDIKNILNIFDVEPIAPKFEVPVVSETIELDLTEFEQLASIVRFFILVGFIISLILITRSVIG